jgi:hypothetical protein
MSYACPCCGNLTLDEPPPGTYAICPVCYWEDDPIQFHDPSSKGGANVVSLQEARANYRASGAAMEQFRSVVRPPRPEERPHRVSDQ